MRYGDFYTDSHTNTMEIYYFLIISSIILGDFSESWLVIYLNSSESKSYVSSSIADHFVI